MLCGIIEKKPVAIPLSDRGMGFHWIVMIDRCRVNLVDFHFCLANSAINIPPTDVTGLIVVRAGI